MGGSKKYLLFEVGLCLNGGLLALLAATLQLAELPAGTLEHGARGGQVILLGLGGACDAYCVWCVVCKNRNWTARLEGGFEKRKKNNNKTR